MQQCIEHVGITRPKLLGVVAQPDAVRVFVGFRASPVTDGEGLQLQRVLSVQKASTRAMHVAILQVRQQPWQSSITTAVPAARTVPCAFSVPLSDCLSC